MADGNARTYYVLTPKGERGPLDRGELRDLARLHEIEPGHQVRNAFGRGLGTVAEILGQRTATPAARPAVSGRSAGPAPRRRAPVALITLGVALAIIACLLIASLGGGATPPPRADPLPVPAPTPAPVLTPTPAPSTAPPAAATPAAVQHADALPGLIAEFFTLDKRPASMPDFSSMKPQLRQIETGFDVTGQATWPRTKMDQLFGMRASGILRVTKAGGYGFFLTSDDASKLLIDGTMVIDNSGLHLTVEKRGSITLQPGDHDIVLLFAQGSGGFACRLAWCAPGEARQILRAPNLMHLPDQAFDH